MKKLFLSLLSAGAFTIHAQVTPPAASQSLQLTGLNYVEVPDNSLLDATSNLTYEGWFNLCEPGTILSKHWCNNAAGYYLIMRPTGKLDFAMVDGINCSSAVASGSSTNAFTFNDWHHFALTISVSGGSTTATLYVDHRSTPESTTSAAWTINNNTEPLRIGVYRGLSGAFSTRPTGRFYDFRAYNQVLAFSNQCLHTPAVTPNMRLDFTGSTGSVITNTGSGSTTFNGTHYNNTAATPTPGTAVATTPNFIATSLSINGIILSASSTFCTNSPISLTASNTASTYSWSVVPPAGGAPISMPSTINTASYTPTAPGIYQFRVLVTVGSCDSVYSINLLVSNCSKMAEISDVTTITNRQIEPVNFADIVGISNIYPNPSSDVITIEFKTEDLTDNSQLRITDVSGKILHTQALSSTTESLSMDISDYTNGIYFAHFVNDSKEIVKTVKFVKN